MTPTLKKLIIALVVLAVIGIVYYEFFDSGTAAPDASLTASSTDVGQDIVTLTQELKSVSIDPSLFSSPLLTNLKDMSIPLNPEAQGRPNPFAPIGQN